jgi:hypothetical protein
VLILNPIDSHVCLWRERPGQVVRVDFDQRPCDGRSNGPCFPAALLLPPFDPHREALAIVAAGIHVGILPFRIDSRRARSAHRHRGRSAQVERWWLLEFPTLMGVVDEPGQGWRKVPDARF